MQIVVIYMKRINSYKKLLQYNDVQLLITIFIKLDLLPVYHTCNITLNVT